MNLRSIGPEPIIIPNFTASIYGLANRIRTCDPRFPKPVLYQAELLPGCQRIDPRDSNPHASITISLRPAGRISLCGRSGWCCRPNPETDPSGGERRPRTSDTRFCLITIAVRPASGLIEPETEFFTAALPTELSLHLCVWRRTGYSKPTPCGATEFQSARAPWPCSSSICIILRNPSSPGGTWESSPQKRRNQRNLSTRWFLSSLFQPTPKTEFRSESPRRQRVLPLGDRGTGWNSAMKEV